MPTSLLKIEYMSENGAIHPCQTPEKNPAGLTSEFVPSPGTQPLKDTDSTRIMTQNAGIFLPFTNSPHFVLIFTIISQKTFTGRLLHNTQSIPTCRFKSRVYVEGFLVFIRYCVYTVIKIYYGGNKTPGYISASVARGPSRRMLKNLPTAG